jgi:DNA-directed RNA polymerase
MITDPVEIETKLEQEMLDNGISKFLLQVHEATEKGEASRLGGFRKILKEMVDPLAEKIEEAIRRESETPQRVGRVQNHRSNGILAQLEPRVTAYLTIKTIIDKVARKETALTPLAQSVGMVLEFESRLREFSAQRPLDYTWLVRDLAERQQSAQHRHKVMTYVMNKHGITASGWAENDRVRVGLNLITWFAELSNAIEIVTVHEGRLRTRLVVQFKEDVLSDIESLNRLLAFNHPQLLPTVIPPRDWTGPTDGGYHHPDLRKRFPLVKVTPHRPRRMQRAYLVELRDRPEQMAPVYAAVNAMQRTRWAVNGRLLAVMRQFWEQGTPIAGLPSFEPDPIPPKPHDIDTNEEARKVWRRKAAVVHVANAVSKSKRVQIAQTLETAKRFQEFEAIYFPHQLDFRGRAYAMPYFNPQGADWVRGLLHFADGKEIKDGIAAGWLAIQGANLFGEADKRSLEDRIGWVEERAAEIKAVAADPFANRYWTGAENPWQFLAWAFEWSDFLDHSARGEPFFSRAVVALDGTCSGLQHFSAILRDERGGASVNLVPSQSPKDIYAEVAAVVLSTLEADSEGDDEEKAALAQAWIASGLVTRKLTKRPVMIVPYSGTLQACRKYVREYLNENGNPFENDWPHITYISKLIWDAIQTVVVSAKQAMKWLQQVAKLASTARVPITWTTPVGFPVVQYYPELKPYKINLYLGSNPIVPSGRIQLTLQKTTGELDVQEQKLGISPNFIHSMDAAAMVAYLNYATENGITHFAMIHDSFGTHAADAQMSAASLRQAFVDMYEGNDVLAQFKEDVAKALPPELAKKLPEPPARGLLDLKAVLQSDYFFA